jgi:hypothetical protein
MRREFFLPRLAPLFLLFVAPFSHAFASDPLPVAWSSLWDGPGSADDGVVGLQIGTSGNRTVLLRSFDGVGFVSTVIEYGSNGERLWTAREEGLEPTAMALFLGTDVLVAGQVVISGQGYRPALVRYRPGVARIWEVILDDILGIPVAIHSDPSGASIYLSTQAWIVKLSPDGEVVWKINREGFGADLLAGSGSKIVAAGSLFREGNSMVEAHEEDGAASWSAVAAEGRPSTIRGLASDADGNIVIAGHVQGSMGSDVYLAQYGPDGQLRWEAEYDGEIHGQDQAAALGVDGEGNVYVAGTTGVEGGSKLLLLKYGAAGDFKWLKTYAGAGSQSAAAALSLNAAGDVLVTGFSATAYEVLEWVTLAFDSSGTLLWSARRPANGSGGPQAIAASGARGACVSGTSPGDTSGADGLTIEYGDDARQLWQDRFDGASSGDDSANAIAIDAESAMVVAGRTARLMSSPVEDLLIQKYDRAGALLWTYRYDSPEHLDDVPFSSAIGADGTTYVTGTPGTLALDPDGRELWVDPSFPGVGIAVAPGGIIFVAARSPDDDPVQSFHLARYAPDGRKVWTRTHSVQGQSWSLARLALDSAGNAVLAGTASLGPPQGGYGVVKFDGNGTKLWSLRLPGGGAFDAPAAVAVDREDAILVTGWGELERNDLDYWTIKLSSKGVLEWQVHRDDIHNDDRAQGIAVDRAGASYVTGTVRGPGGQGVSCLTVKYRTDGTELWMARLPDGYDPLIAVGGGSVYVAARVYISDEVFGLVVVRYDAETGAELGRSSWGGVPSALALDSDGNLHLAGSDRKPGRRDFDLIALKYATPSPSFLRGDCDGDGRTSGSVTDGVAVLQYAFLRGPTPPCLAACDVDGDGAVSGITDAVYIFMYSFLGGPAPPEPFPACGKDHEESLSCAASGACP